MQHELLKSQRTNETKWLIHNALIAMHFCEDLFELSDDNTPFTVREEGRVVTISIDDTYQYYKEIVDTFTDQMDKRKAFHAAQKERAEKAKTKKTVRVIDKRLVMVCSILKKASDEVLFHEKSHTITISVKGNHSYTIAQMRKLCTLFSKYNPVFTCRSNHFIITITVNDN